MKWIGRLSLFIVSSLFIWGVIYAYNQVTDGFTIRQMTSSLPYNPQFDPPVLSQERMEGLSKLLDQPFFYLGKGCQFYAFESEDGKSVIKFLKHKHLRPLTWLRSIRMPKKLRDLSEQKIAQRFERANKLFSSCQLAFEELPEETGLLYIHLNASPAFKKRMIIIDKVGCKHSIAIDDYEFVLQKRAIPVKEAFAELIAKGEKEKIAEKIEQLISLVQSRCDKGIRDRDRSFVQNVAFCAEEDRAVFIDIGQFFKDDTVLKLEEQSKDLSHRLNNLRFWTEKHFPEILSLVDNPSEFAQ